MAKKYVCDVCGGTCFVPDVATGMLICQNCGAIKSPNDISE